MCIRGGIHMYLKVHMQSVLLNMLGNLGEQNLQLLLHIRCSMIVVIVLLHCTLVVLLQVGTFKEKENKLEYRENNRVGHNNNLSTSSTKRRGKDLRRDPTSQIFVRIMQSSDNLKEIRGPKKPCTQS